MQTVQRASFNEFGQPENVLEVVSVELPELQEGQVKVKMLAAPINPADVNFVQGVYGIKPELPAFGGLEGYGEVLESRDKNFQVGDKVIAIKRIGSWGEALVTEGQNLLVIRQNLDPIQASMLKVNPLTALRLILEHPEDDPKEGAWIVQNAANSGVGRCLIQIAKQMGFRTINLVRRPELIEEIKALGGDVVVLDDAEAVAKALEATGGERPMLASNSVGGDSALRLMDMLAPKGRMVTFGAMSKKSIKVPNGFLIFKGIELRGLWVTKWLENASAEEIEAAYDQLADWMEQGILIQAVDSIYSLSEIRQACQRAQTEARDGKVVLQFS